MTSVTVRAPAKINLHLAVGPPRPDGFHEVATAYHAISLYDEVVATWGGELRVSVTGADGIPVEGVPTDERNLALRAVLHFADAVDMAPDVGLHITKGIPVAGGMAGGSADAAAAIVACDALWQTGMTRAELTRVAATLGSDVPFSLVGGTALGTGRGEILTPVLARGRFHWVVAIADGGLSTPAVYAECDRLRADDDIPEPGVSDALMSALRGGDAHALGAALHNDLQEAALSLRPELRQTLDTGSAAGALGAMVSGSGPTVVFLAQGPEHAIDLAVALSATGTCRAVKRATGPVAGARPLGES